MRTPTPHLDAAPVYARIEFTELLKVASRQHEITWEPFRDGVEIHRFYGEDGVGPSAALLKFSKAGKVPLHEHDGYEHILILAGSQRDNNGVANTGTLIINPPGTRHSIVSEAGCIVLAIYEKPVRFLAPPAELAI